MQLYEQTLDMGLHGLLSNAELRRDLFVAQAFRDQLENLDLASRQTALILSRREALGDFRRHGPLARKDLSNGGNQILRQRALQQIARRTGADRPVDILVPAKNRQNDDLRVWILATDRLNRLL